MIGSVGGVIAQKIAEKCVEYVGTWGSDSMQDLKRKWQVLNSRASDIEGQVKSTEMSGKKKRKREVEDWLKGVEKLKPTFDDLEARGPCWRPTLREDPVGKMQNQVNELIEQSHHFDGLVLDSFDNIGEPCCPTKLFGEKTKQKLETIWPSLVTDGISNIGIYGMAGVGKTTLAKHIKFRLEKKKYQVFWVTVSQEFSIKGLQDKIAKFLHVSLSDKDEEEERANILRGAMTEKGTFVLILDDVWDEFSLERIGISLGASKCRLILTTRSLEVCNRMSYLKFGVETLNEYESWDLFKYTLQNTELRANIEEIAKSVTRRCGGLPLGIVTVAGSMRGVSDICEWRNTLEQLKACSEGHDKMGSDVFPILEWSYSRLNDYQRHCFLYCCLYPEDEDIPREELINIFICAELMDGRSTRNLEIDQGHAILNHLIRVCLLEETTCWKEIKCVKMHDLIRDMALRITSGKNSLETTKNTPRFLVSIVQTDRILKIKSEQKEEWREDLSAVSIDFLASERLGIPMDMSPNCPNLSTLLFQHRYFCCQNEIPSSFFNQMRGLKVLKLNLSFIKQLPDIISDMVNLVALLLLGCLNLASVPPLGKLSQLRILDLSLTEIEDIPEGLERLFNLEVICLDHTKLKGIPKGTLSKLRHLQQLKLDDNVVVDDPEVLNQLEVFYGSLSSVDVYNQHINFGRLKYFRIEVTDRIPAKYWIIEEEDSNKLMFSSCNFHWGSNVGRVCLLPQDIKELILDSCIGMDKCISDVFPTLSSSKELSYLRIEKSAEVEFLLKLSSSPPDEPVMSPCDPFQNLEFLRLRDLPNFIELFTWDSKALHRHLPPGTFSSLINLDIRRCKKMRKLFTVQLLQNLQNLKVLHVSECEELEEITADDIEVGSGGGCIQLTSAGATNTLILPKLLKLYLSQLPKLKNICKGTIICNSIKNIRVINCPEVKRLPLFPPKTVFEIRGTKKWWESLEWDNPNSKNALDPFFREEEEYRGEEDDDEEYCGEEDEEEDEEEEEEYCGEEDEEDEEEDEEY